MRKILVALALAALALNAVAMGDKPDEARLAASAAKQAASAATAASAASGASARDAASSARQSVSGASSSSASAGSAAASAMSANQAASAAAVAKADAASSAKAAAKKTSLTVRSTMVAGFSWVHFGRDPYASSRDEAMRNRESAFRALGFPEPVVALVMIATDKPGEKTRISVGDHLDVMLSKGGVTHRNVTVAFVSPVRGMEYAAPAEKWTVAWEGKTYTVILPEVCNNWSLVVGLAPLAPIQSAPPMQRLPVAASICPQGWSVTANAWSLGAMPPALRQQVLALVAAAAARDTDRARRLEPYTPDAVSRTMGRPLREQMQVRAPVTDSIQIRYLDTQTAQVVRELGALTLVGGMGTFRFPDDPRQYVVEMVWPAAFVSPTVSGGQRRLRIFPPEWKICAPNVTGVVP